MMGGSKILALLQETKRDPEIYEERGIILVHDGTTKGGALFSSVYHYEDSTIIVSYDAPTGYADVRAITPPGVAPETREAEFLERLVA